MEIFLESDFLSNALHKFVELEQKELRSRIVQLSWCFVGCQVYLVLDVFSKQEFGGVHVKL